jgi:hypothetical protein
MPLFAHVGAATLKRIISPRPPRAWSSALTVTGYTLALCLLPIHYLTHRLLPTDPSPPTDSFGPAELDYEFVKTAITAWPVRAGLTYALLVGFTLFHLAEGINVLQLANRLRGMSKRTRRLVAGAAVLPVISGLLIMAREPLLVFGPLAGRYRGVFERIPIFWV